MELPVNIEHVLDLYQKPDSKISTTCDTPSRNKKKGSKSLRIYRVHPRRTQPRTRSHHTGKR